MSKHSFGVTTSVPVIVIGVPLVLGVMKFAVGFNLLTRVERGMRTVTALTFIGTGAFMLWNRISGTL
jgi:hypothetical protein